MTQRTFKDALKGAAVSLGKRLPVIFATILLISLLNTVVPKSFYAAIFQRNEVIDSLLGSVIGSISAGNPITSYIIGGELISRGVSLIAVTAFVVAWVTVGVVQFPAEMSILGRKFAFLRNITSFVFAVFVAFATVIIVNLL